MANLDVMEVELRKFIDNHRGKSKEVDARLMAVEQALVARGGGAGSFGADKSIGQLVIESDNFELLKKGAKETGKIHVGSLHKTITGSPGGPLVPPTYYPQIVPPGLRPLTVRDLLSQNRTTSNLIQYTREEGFENNAAPQAGEGVAKPESDLTFSLQNAPVQTIAHFISASTQVLDDAPALQDYIDTRLMYGLKLVEENQLVNGDGTGFDLHGILPQASAYSGSGLGTMIDVLGRALEQVGTSGFLPDAIVMSLHDAWSLFMTKSDIGTYMLSDALSAPNPRVWGVPVVIAQTLANGTFLVGAFKQGAALWDRMDATILISREHADYFTRNMAAILCEERLALTVFRPTAFVRGSVTTGS